MSKVLLINGSPNEYGCTYTALQEIIDTLHGLDVGTELVCRVYCLQHLSYIRGWAVYYSRYGK